MKYYRCKNTCAIKLLSSFWKTLEIFSINCKINLILTWSVSVISEDNRPTTFAITDAKLYVPVVTLSTQDNTKLAQ